MARYSKQVSMGGKWAKGSELEDVKRARITNEVEPTESAYKSDDGKTKWQHVARVKFEGINDPLNLNLNRATLNALVDAFGEESAEWIDKPLSVETEKMRVAGKAVTAVYLIPDGYKRIDDENGYALIVKDGEAVEGVGVDNDDDF